MACVRAQRPDEGQFPGRLWHHPTSPQPTLQGRSGQSGYVRRPCTSTPLCVLADFAFNWSPHDSPLPRNVPGTDTAGCAPWLLCPVAVYTDIEYQQGPWSFHERNRDVTRNCTQGTNPIPGGIPTKKIPFLRTPFLSSIKLTLLRHAVYRAHACLMHDAQKSLWPRTIIATKTKRTLLPRVVVAAVAFLCPLHVFVSERGCFVSER